jgi:hypothetical protein
MAGDRMEGNHSSGWPDIVPAVGTACAARYCIKVTLLLTNSMCPLLGWFCSRSLPSFLCFATPTPGATSSNGRTIIVTTCRQVLMLGNAYSHSLSTSATYQIPPSLLGYISFQGQQ